MSKTALTLSEVLITLGIIGIIAAMTLPALVAQHRKKELHSQFKKSYTEINQINLNFIKDENMNMCEYAIELSKKQGSYGQEATTLFSKKFGSYMKVSSKNPVYWTPIATEARKSIKNLRNITSPSTQHLFDDAYNNDVSGKSYYFEMAATSKCPIISIDLNGYKKLPNRLGFDIFSFRPTLTGKIIPMGYPESSNINGSGNNTECSYKTNGTTNGIGCAYWANIDINPDDQTKTYWKDFIKY